MAAPCPDSSAIEILPYKASYELMREGKKAGHATRELKQIDRNNWQLSMNSKASLFFVTFSYQQQSNFSWVNNKPRPDSFLQTDKNSFKAAVIQQQTFDWLTMLEDGSYKKQKWQLKVTPDIQDRQLSLLSLRLDLLQQDYTKGQQKTFQYSVSYKGEVSDESYQFVAEESITTPAGIFETHKYQKTHDNKSRVSYFWLAKKLKYLPIRIQQLKDGEEQANMLLTAINP